MGQADKDALNEKIAAGQAKEKKQKRRERREKLKKEKTSFLTDFKKFITKGNVLDMAVAVVVATAFNAIVTGLVKNIITPFVTYLTSGVSINEWKWVLRPAVEETDTTEIAVSYGLWLQSIVDFLIIAFTVFVFVRVVTNMQKRMNWREEEKKAAEAAKKKAADDAAAAAAAEKAAALAKREEEYYQNVKAQADLLKDIKELLEKKEK